MKRKLIDKLLEWKESPDPKPILLTGGRSVGKTYLAYDFANSFYKEYIYINFETEPYLYNLLFKNNPSQIENVLKDYFHLSGSSGPILLILDELAGYQDIIMILNLLSNSRIRFHIVCVSSIFTTSMNTDNRFYHLQLFPLDFEEFLVATGNEWYIEVITVHYKSDSKIPDIVHQELITLFELYICIGGMPLAVNEYISTNALYNIAEQHRILVNSYHSDIYNRNQEGDFLKINQAFNTISSQLTKENRKFQYKLIRKGATQALYSDALCYIQNSGYGMCSYKLSEELINSPVWTAPSPEFMSLEQKNGGWGHLSFKLYMLDTGILYSIIRTQLGPINDRYRKGIIENYVAQCLTSNGYPLFFWESDSQAKLDFIIRKDNYLVPLEVRTSDNTRSRNVSIFRTKYQNKTDFIKDSIKISTRNFEYSNHVKYVPVYAVFCI